MFLVFDQCFPQQGNRTVVVAQEILDLAIGSCYTGLKVRETNDGVEQRVIL